MELYIIFIAIMSITAFIVYGIDKRRAVKHRRRLDESLLLGLGIMGGAPGAILAMEIFRHKTQHWYFWAINFTSAVVCGVLFVYII